MDDWQEKHYHHFWARMLGIYGKRWVEDHGKVANPTWRDALKKMAFSRVAGAVDVCMNSNDAHPITLSQFVFRAKSVKLRPGFELLPSPTEKEFTPADIRDNRKKLVRLAREVIDNCSKMYVYSYALKDGSKGKYRTNANDLDTAKLELSNKYGSKLKSVAGVN